MPLGYGFSLISPLSLQHLSFFFKAPSLLSHDSLPSSPSSWSLWSRSPPPVTVTTVRVKSRRTPYRSSCLSRPRSRPLLCGRWCGVPLSHWRMRPTTFSPARKPTTCASTGTSRGSAPPRPRTGFISTRACSPRRRHRRSPGTRREWRMEGRRRRRRRPRKVGIRRSA